MKGDKVTEIYANFVDDNQDSIINDFCNKIKEHLIGDLTLDEYSRFMFWKNYSEE